MQRSLGLVQVDEIYLTHFHADHILGLPGLLKTYDLTDREAPLTIYGPPGLRELFTVLRPTVGRLGYDLDLVELRAGRGGRHDDYEVAGLRSRPQRAGPRLRAGRGRAAGALRPRGGEGGSACPKARPSRRCSVARRSRARRHGAPGAGDGAEPARPHVVLTGDTAPCPTTVAAAADAELLIHDATFAEEDARGPPKPATRPSARRPRWPPRRT